MSCTYGHCSLRMDPLQFQNAVPKRLVHLLRQDFCLSKIFFLRNLHLISPRITWCHCSAQWELDLHSTCLLSRHLTAFCWHQWLFFWAQLELFHTFLKCPYFHSQTPRLPDFTLPDSRTRLGPAELFADLLLRLAASWRASPDNKTTNWRQIYPGWRCSESWSFLLLITSSCKSNLQQQSQSSQSPLSDDLESTCHWVFPKIDFVKFHFDPFGLSDLSDLSPNLQDFPGLLAFHESTISSNKPLQYLPCGHAMLFSLFGIWELNSLKSSEQCSNYENLWIHRWGESFTCGEPQTAKEWINNVGHLMYICSAILRLPSGRFAFWRLCISWLKFF